MSNSLYASKNSYIGLCCVTLSVLMYEILLTRIFSVISYYHFAFMAISIAMFGMTVGSMLVYLLKRFQNDAMLSQHLAITSMSFAASIPASIFLLLSLRFNFQLNLASIVSTTCMYAIISVPFIFSGMTICLALTKFPRQVNTLYAADLIGAALGCIAAVLTINTISGPSAVLATAVIGGLGAIFFSKDSPSVKWQTSIKRMTIVLFILALINIVTEFNQTPLLRIEWAKGAEVIKPLYEKWNSFSRVTVTGDPLKLQPPYNWGLSSTYPPNRKTQYLMVELDSSGISPLINFNHDLSTIDYLKYDVVNAGYYLTQNANVLIVGVGGGREILAALAFKEASVLGIELNPNIINIVKNKFADYSGNITKIPNVTLINDEARSYITRSQAKYDFIQLSFIDTWAATAAGAYALSENGLYTTEAWNIFLSHLTPQGILSVSRWYLIQQPAELYRLTALAATSLQSLGIKQPEQHIIILAANQLRGRDQSLGVATMLVSKSPLTTLQMDITRQIAKDMNFKIVLLPDMPADPALKLIASGRELSESDNGRLSPFDLTPPTDNKPFFFQILKLSRIFDTYAHKYDLIILGDAVRVLGVLAIIVVFLSTIFIILPLYLKNKASLSFDQYYLLFYFASIGFGFMLVEISQIERLTLFLGNPTYGLSVVLFTLLVATGLGSALVSYLPKRRYTPLITLITLIVILTLFGSLTRNLTSYFIASSTPVRILVSGALIFPMGLLMGTAMPLGFMLASHQSRDITPWLWGINGATSICGSVFAIVIALAAGITASFWVGVISYLLAVTTFYKLVT